MAGFGLSAPWRPLPPTAETSTAAAKADEDEWYTGDGAGDDATDSGDDVL